MIVTFLNASGFDFGNFLNAHLRSKILSPKYLTSTAMTFDTFSLYYDTLQLAAGSFIYKYSRINRKITTYLGRLESFIAG